MDGYGTSYLAGSNWYNSKQRLELDEDAIFTKGPIPVLGSGSYAPYNTPKYPIMGIQHLPKGQESVTLRDPAHGRYPLGTQGYLLNSKAPPKHVPNGTNDPLWSHKW
jgi:hypothetical protein